jgi:hypothetical protein
MVEMLDFRMRSVISDSMCPLSLHVLDVLANKAVEGLVA